MMDIIVPKVVIKCTTYNHEPYIRKCLDGFVNQRTNFSFVAIVHDDASNDGTTQIVRDYAKKYPDMIYPIYEEENQWSKHDGTINSILNEVIEKLSPKYVAICEGDDYWVDPLKLQKQVDVMDADDGISMCYTRNKCFSVKKNQFSNTRGTACVDFRTFLLYDETITLTVLIRNDLHKKYFEEIKPNQKGWLMGDTPLWLWLAKNGRIKPLDDITAVYNAHPGSSSRSGAYKKQERFNKSALDIRLFFIEKYNDCKDLIPYLYDKYYRANMSDAYDFGEFTETVKNFYKIKKKKKNDYFVMIKLLPKVICRKFMVQK